MLTVAERKRKLNRLKATTHAWGKFGFPVTESQFHALSALSALLDGHHRTFSSQSDNGSVVIGFGHRSIEINRRGQIIGNFTTT